MNNTYIIKNTGEKELFDANKLDVSLRKAGVNTALRNEIITHIETEITDGMSTSDIYKNAYSLLTKNQKGAAIKYSVRRAVLNLGPSGFPFEKLVAEIYMDMGYTVITDQYIKGKCAEHEMDVICYKDSDLVMLEAKFHNQDGVKSDLKVALYVRARFDDLYQAEFNFGNAKKLKEGILITNTKFTHTAIHYAKCSGLKLIGWNYPKENNLQELIEKHALHPITCLSSLSSKQEKSLLKKDVVLLRNIKARPQVLGEIGLSKKEQEEVFEEINSII